MTLHSQRFMTHNELTSFVVASAITAANIEAIATDSANGGFVLWWWA